jgi:hypothetical protein
MLSLSAFPHRFDHYNCTAMLETEDHADVESGTAWSLVEEVL